MENTGNTRGKSIGDEFLESTLGDKRRAKRLRRIAELWARGPDKSLPQTMGSPAEQEATYRFLNNDNISFLDIICGHYEATSERAEQYQGVLVVHDTTEFSFTTKRAGLGRMAGEGSRYGFFCHASLCVGLSSLRNPLGLLATQYWTRTAQVKAMRKNNGYKEMDRWYKGVELAEERLTARAQAIHVMDREGDSYELFHHLLKNDHRFIIRACHDRVAQGGKLFEHAAEAPIFAERMVALSTRKKPRTPRAREIYPERRRRMAKLAISAKTITLNRSGYLRGRKEIEKQLELNLIHVQEIDCEEGIEPVTWYLLTSESIDTAEDVLAVVDAYRARWLIEEFFKSIKTGCKYEQLQLESYEALLRSLAIYLVVAWMILRLRYLAGAAEDLPAQVVLNDVQLQVLRIESEKPLPQEPTARDVLLAIAVKGGHFKHNGDPGWLVIARGMHDLLLMEQGFRVAMALLKSDKS